MRFLLPLLLLWLTGCAAPLVSTRGDCRPAIADGQAVQLTLRSADGKRQQLSLHNRWQADELQLVAINPVGAVLFSGSLGDQTITSRASPLYRGVDPELLLRVYGWWLQRDNRAPCWQTGGLSVHSLADGEQQLTAGRLQLLWHPEHPERVGLPRQGLELVFRMAR